MKINKIRRACLAMSVDIVRDYICSKSSVSSFLTLKSFKRFFPSGTLDSLIESLYEAMILQRKEATAHVSNRLPYDFEVFMSGDEARGALDPTGMDFTSFSALTDDICKLEECIETKIIDLNGKSNLIMTEVNEQTDFLKETIASFGEIRRNIGSSRLAQLTSDLNNCRDEVFNHS